MAIADRDRRGPGDVLEHVVCRRRRNGVAQGEEHVLPAFHLRRDHLIGPVRAEGVVIDEFDRVPREEGGEAVGLRMHEAHADLMGRGFVHDAEIRAVDVDGVVVRAGEGHGIDEDPPPASGEVQHVGPGAGGAAAADARGEAHAFVGDVLGELVDDAHAAQGVKRAVAEGDVAAVDDEAGDHVAEGFAELDDAALGEAGVGVEVQAHAEGGEFLGLGDAAQRSAAAPPGASVVGRVKLLIEPGAVGAPAFADPDKASVLDGVGAVLLDLHLGMMFGDIEDGEFGDERPAIVEGDPRDGHILRAVTQDLDHLAVNKEVAAVALQPEVLHPLQQNRDGLGGVGVVVAVGDVQGEAPGLRGVEVVFPLPEVDFDRSVGRARAHWHEGFGVPPRGKKHPVAGGEQDRVQGFERTPGLCG